MNKPSILIFYDGYELKARKNSLQRIFHVFRNKIRALVRKASGKQVNTGFYEAFLAIVNGLQRLGYEVRINDFESARKDPTHPIGLAGYPDVITHVDLPNPVIFGPGDPGYPDEAAKFAAKPSTRLIIQPSEWFVDYYRPYCGDKMIRCPVGIDIDHLPDVRDERKSVDMLIYDKVRWHRDAVVPATIERLKRALDARSMSYEVIRYGDHRQDDYFAHLRRARSMAFICEHETQGLACEEALAMNVPVFAWDEGKLVDPLQRRFASDDLRTSAVPYFDERCGAIFTLDDLEDSLDKFWESLPGLAPREFVAETLRPEMTAQVYLDAYLSLFRG